MTEGLSKNRQEWIRSLKSSKKSSKNYFVALALSLFFGILGADRFYLGYLDLGALKLISFGGMGLWWLLDLLLLLRGELPDADGGELKGPFQQKKDDDSAQLSEKNE